MGSVRVAIAGVGNCAASLVQGVHYYADADPATTVPGLMHVQFGDYHVRDVEFVAAFDVDAKKVGFDLAEAIVASENNTIKICDVPPLGVTVQRGPTLDGLGRYYRETIEEADAEPVDVTQVLRDSGADVLVCYLPVGSQQAAEFYAQAAIDAGVRSSTRCPSSSRPTRCGPRSSPTRACRSSATTSRARSAPRSRTGSWPSCSRTAASSSTARTS
jgi:myo-inositol-1-phosphate synthase